MDIKQWFLKYYWVVNLLFLALIAWFLASAVNGITARKLAPGVAQAKPATVSPRRAELDYRPDSNRIVSRDLFRSAPAAWEIALTRPVDEDTAVTETNLRVQLVFITYLAPSHPANRATIKNLRDQKTGLYAAGAPLVEDGTIMEIEVDRVLIARSNGRIEELTLKKTEDKPRPARATAARPRAAGYSREELTERITRLSESEFLVDRTALNQVLENLDQFVSEAGLRPVYSGYGDERALSGFMLRMKRGSMVEALGLNQGDVLKSINGGQLNVSSMVPLLESLREQSNFTLDIERNDEPMQLRYRVQ